MRIRLGLGKMSIGAVAEHCGGNVVGNKDISFEYICTDSREACEGTLFVAMRGERVDGHDFMRSAYDRGCRCFLCDHIPDGMCDGQAGSVLSDAGLCVTADPSEALFSVSKGYGRGDICCVAVTGSVGKTTTKQLTALVLAEGGSVYCTEGNYNSTIGMPLSFMEISGGCERAVLEMGMSGLGEISRMSRLARPTVAMVTCIGSSHLEYLKTRENIVRAKLEIADGLRDGGVLLLSGDEPLLRDDMLRRGLSSDISDRCRVMYVSMRGDGDFCVENIRVQDSGSLFDIRMRDGIMRDIFVPLIGEHMVFDACFAASAGIILGMTREQICAGLGKYVPDRYRQRIYEVGGIKVISDCYNAAPESVGSALSVLGSIKAARRIAVLGDMRELGEVTHKAHRETGERVYGSGVDVLVTIGALGRLIAEGARDSGMRDENIFMFDEGDYDGAAACLDGMLCDGDAVLFKASRPMRLECVMDRTEKIRSEDSSVG